MLNVPTQPPTGSSALRLQGPAPTAENIAVFLQCGALFAWSEDRWIIAWGEPENLAKPCSERPSFYAPDFMLSEPRPWKVYPHAAAVSPDGLAQQMPAEFSSRVWRGFDASLFAATFHEVENARQRGELAKAVPAVFEHSDGALRATERVRALRAMANFPAGLMPYGHWDKDGGCLGASPELLFEDDGVEIHTMAVAGTARAGSAPDEIMEDAKERTEHTLVLDDVTAQISPLGSVARGATRLWRIGMLSHLRTDLRVTPSRAVAFDELVTALHPTPAVGVAPRAAWREWVPRLDHEDRGTFAAPFGLLLPDGTSRCLVAIRGVQWNRHATRCGAGCGLVAGSDLSRETAELRLKLAATRGNLGL